MIIFWGYLLKMMCQLEQSKCVLSSSFTGRKLRHQRLINIPVITREPVVKLRIK